MRNLKYFWIIVFFLPLLLIHCSKDDNPVEPPLPSTDVTYTHIIDIQQKLNTVLTELFASLDTASALDSVKKLFLTDTAVSAAYADVHGINVQYKNGMRGGIFINGDDEDEVLNKNSELPNSDFDIHKTQLTIPNSKTVIFVNPHYYERSDILSREMFFYNYPEHFSLVSYSFTYKLSEEATLDLFTKLSSYGYIHIYSHGRPWPSKDSLSEVYILTGEKVSDKTTQKFFDDVKTGNIIIGFVSKVNSNVYFISPQFLAKYNNFQNSGSLIYGGFCYSFLGSWSNQMVTNAKAKVYMGFDWSVNTRFNLHLSLDLSASLCSNGLSEPITVGSFMLNPLNETNYWNAEDNRLVNLKYNGASDFALWGNVNIKSLIPDRGTVGTTVDVCGKGFGNSKGTSTVKFNGVNASTISWSDTLIKTTVPAGATTGNVIVTVDGKESNGVLFTIDGPEITSINPDSAFVGDIIYLGGKNFGTDISVVKVFFNSIQAVEITECRDTYIGVKIPQDATSGNVHVEVKEIASNSHYFTVRSQAPFIDRIVPSSALPGNYIYLYGSWKPTTTTPPNTYLRVGGVSYPIDPDLNWNATSYLKLLLPAEVSTSTQEISLIYEGQESNKVNLYVGIPLDSIYNYSTSLGAYARIYVQLLKPDLSTTSTTFEIGAEANNVLWDGLNFTAGYTLTNYYTDEISGRISEDGMKVIQLTIHKKWLNNSGEVTLSLKPGESIDLDSTYYSNYTTNLFMFPQNFLSPDYRSKQEDLLSKFTISGTVELIAGQVYTVQSIISTTDETGNNLYLDFK